MSLDTTAGERLTDTYLSRFYQDFWQCGPDGCWKLERRQHFVEPDSPSWVAFARGDWEKSVQLTTARRSALTEYYRRIAARGFYTCRVRVVERPISPYLQWESYLLRLRDELGGAVRVIGAEQVVEHEGDGQLPEIVTIGSNVMYQIIYDSAGLLQGGIRYTDPDLVRRWRDLINQLYIAGESMQGFFQREVAPLAAPSVRRK